MVRKILSVIILLVSLPSIVMAQNYTAPTAPLGGTETVPCIQGGGFKGCTPSIIRQYSNNNNHVYDVRDYGASCNGLNTTDDAPGFQAAANAATNGSVIFFPAGCYINTPIVVTKSVIFQSQGLNAGLYIPNVTGFIVQTSEVTFRDIYVYGNHSSSTTNMFVQAINNSAELSLLNIRGELLNTFVDIQGGFAHKISNVRLRNMYSVGVHLEGWTDTGGAWHEGVELLMNGFEYDNDGSWYGSCTYCTYSEPTVSALWVQDFDGIVMTNYSIIHGGQIANLYINPQHTRSGDHWIGTGYFDINVNGDGIKFNPQGTAIANRTSINGAWIATQQNGIHITGSNQVEGISVNASMIYNQQQHGWLDDNTSNIATTQTIRGTLFASNSQATAGTYDDIKFAPTGSSSYVQIDNNTFNNSMGNSQVLHNIEIASGNASISNNDTTYSNTAASKISGVNNTSVVNKNGWTQIGTTQTANNSSSIVFSQVDISSYSSLMIVYGSFSCVSASEPAISVSSNGGGIIDFVNGEYTQFTSSNQFRNQNFTVGRSTTSAYGGNLEITGPINSNKLAIYSSSLSGISGQGLTLTGRVEDLSPINYVSVGCASGNINTGTVSLFGKP